jgi:hypothetical protein
MLIRMLELESAWTDYLFIMLYSTVLLSLLVPESYRPNWAIAFDLKRIIFTLSVELSN